jgi:hypothetical protein
MLALGPLPVLRPSTQPLLSAAGTELPGALPGRIGPGPDRRRSFPPHRRPRQARKASVDTNGSAVAQP